MTFEDCDPLRFQGSRIGVLESDFQDILQRQVACNREDHGVCYYRPGRDEHVLINKKALDSWVQQLCRDFAIGLEPPQGLLDSLGIEKGMSDIERDAMIEIGPGYLCGLAMERIGTKLLYGTKIPMLVGKCFFNTRRVEEHQRGLRPSYPPKIRYPGKWLLINTYIAFISGLGTSEEAKIGRVIVVLAHVIDLMVFIEDSPAKTVPRNFLVTAMVSPRYSYHTSADTSKHP
ncbi:hypothetical protein BU17DRAFT_72481 [Hysterangium stoloniferum]|nr:hypothetical protein BU17DRAFT_72481 [Hysterangium stoloniferum]